MRQIILQACYYCFPAWCEVLSTENNSLMIRNWAISFLLLFSAASLSAQTDSVRMSNTYSNSVSAGFVVPIGHLGETHPFGIQLNYSWAHNRQGRHETKPGSVVGIVAEAGMGYYLGKTESILNEEFRYDNYTTLHLMVGAIYNPVLSTNIKVIAGPTLGLYMGTSEFGLGGKIEIAHYFDSRFCITPGFMLAKHSLAPSLLRLSLGVGYAF